MYSVEFKNITKRFGNLTANDNISLSIKSNSVHCILGENGAGKSTLMKILFGVYKQDSGEIYIKGKKISFNSPLDAIDSGIGMLYQHFMLIDDFTVMENVILGKELTAGLKLNFPKIRKALLEIIGRYNLNVELDRKVSDLSISEQQKVELLKILYRDSGIIILDEPTAVLSPVEVYEFFNIVRNFIKDGRTVLLITHKLAEVKEIAETVTVLRKGKNVYETERKKLDIGELSRQIIGDIFPKEKIKEEDIEYISGKQKKPACVVKLERISYSEKGKNILNNFELNINEGEIIGVCGVEGNGQNEITDILTGIIKNYKGEYERKTDNISVVPDDRLKKGMIKEFSVGESILLRKKGENKITQKRALYRENEIKKMYDIMIPYPGCPMAKLSGGNQQKAIVAREIQLDSKFIIFSHPTRGVDIKASSFIYNKIIGEKNKGNAILLISSDVDELIFLSDRIVILYKGRILKEYTKEEIGKSLETGRMKFLEEVGKYMIGITE
ncbi:MAG: ABC transporter ATP-binding protein [Ignavibacteria bacterium]|nr:ABC transporter ATP-binding protein [Ignavibacteria bacterium]